MNDTGRQFDFLSYISPDPCHPEVGLVRIKNSKIHYIAQTEGFLGETPPNNTTIITDEERLVVKIMFNHDSSILIKREQPNPLRIIFFFHRDGIISCENSTADDVLFHCFASVDDAIEYHISAFIPDGYQEPQFPFHFLLPTDRAFYRTSASVPVSQKIRRSVLQKLLKSDMDHPAQFNIEKGYVEEWDDVHFSVQLIANNIDGESGYLGLFFCNTCIWAIYPDEKNYARMNVIGSADAQNKFCHFITAFAREESPS